MDNRFYQPSPPTPGPQTVIPAVQPLPNLQMAPQQNAQVSAALFLQLQQLQQQQIATGQPGQFAQAPLPPQSQQPPPQHHHQQQQQQQMPTGPWMAPNGQNMRFPPPPSFHQQQQQQQQPPSHHQQRGPMGAGGPYQPGFQGGPLAPFTGGHDEMRALREKISRTLFVRNITYQTHEQELRQIFGRFGEIRKIFNLIDKRGMAFITYFDIRDALKARDDLQHLEIEHRHIDVHFSLPKEKEKETEQDRREYRASAIIVTLKDTPGNTIPSSEEFKRHFDQLSDVMSVHDFRLPNQKIIEFYDVRGVDKCLNKENGKNFANGRLEIVAATRDDIELRDNVFNKQRAPADLGLNYTNDNRGPIRPSRNTQSPDPSASPYNQYPKPPPPHHMGPQAPMNVPPYQQPQQQPPPLQMQQQPQQPIPLMMSQIQGQQPQQGQQGQGAQPNSQQADLLNLLLLISQNQAAQNAQNQASQAQAQIGQLAGQNVANQAQVLQALQALQARSQGLPAPAPVPASIPQVLSPPPSANNPNAAALNLLLAIQQQQQQQQQQQRR